MMDNNTNNGSSQRLHPIGVVSRRTGLKPDLIRAWERRYGAVAPERSQTRRRFYTDDDIERLQLLRKAVSGGRSIGQVAALDEDELRELIEGDEPPQSFTAVAPPTAAIGNQFQTAEELLEVCLGAIRNLDARELESHFERASVSLSRVNLLERLLVPLMQKVGELWRDGDLRPVHEHLAAAAVRTFVGNLPGAYNNAAGSPRILVTTPQGQMHELGALMASATAALEGWNVTYLGANLPAEEIAAGALQRQVRAVALSITFPPDDTQLSSELVRLNRLLPVGTVLIVGGRSVYSYASVLRQVGARILTDLQGLKSELESLRLQ